MSPRDEGAPDFKAPPGSCDAHFHVFGAPERYEYGADIRYKPPLAPLEDYLELARHLGIERYVFVQPSAYGRNNACLLDALQSVGARARAIVDIEENAPESEFERLNRLGVRGVRINVNPIKPPEPGYSKTMLARIERLDARCAEIGWMLDFLTPGWLTEELLPVLRKLEAQFSVAHMGMFLAREGPKQPGFQQFIDLVKNETDRGWVKLTGVYRMSVTKGFTDADAMARALIGAVPDRLIWGSDYPHLSFADKVGSVELFNLLGRWAPDEAERRKILVENPQRLFGFAQA